MMDRLKSFFIASDIDDPVIQREVRKANLTRSLITTCGAILFSAAVISAFSQSPIHSTVLETSWRDSVVKLNCIAVTINTIIACIGLYILRYKNTDHILYTYLPYTLMVVIGAWGIAGTILHQLISWNIVPFMLASFVIVMLLIRPVVLFYYFAILYVLFYFLIPINQYNPNYILLNRVLGLATLFLSYCFSLLTWNNNLVRFRQNRLVELQAEQLRESNASKDKFFSILSHDLKGPVATSLLLTEMLQEDNVGEQERKEIQELFRSSLENISRLLNNVLLWANNQTGKISFNPTPIDLRVFVEEDFQLLHAMAIHKNITLVNDVPKDFFIQADRDMMHTVLRNLLTNAIKFTHAKGKVNVFAEQLKANTITSVDHVKISIVDNGVGISPTLLDDLFKLDKKVMTPGTNNETGTGLGLILCKDFVEKHNGQFFVESQEQTGSHFMFTIPL
jgi:two-component system sensor histidine kinase/response regulator